MPESRDPEYDDRSQRIDALRALAQQGDEQATTPSQSSQPALPALSAPGRRSRKTLLAAVLAALALVAVVGGLVAHALITPSSAKSPQQSFVSSVVHPGGNDAACAQDAAWSPDGATIAFLGYQLSCPSSDPTAYAYHAGMIVLYDVAHGAVSSRIKPDPIIAAALGLKAPAVATPQPFTLPGDHDTSQQVIDYSHLLWSRDGKQLAITFSVQIATGVSDGHHIATKAFKGVLLLSPSGGNPRILSHTLAPNERYSGLWNLTTGQYIPVGATPASPAANAGWNATQALLPPATAYQWDDTGHIHPLSPTAAVGQPNGGKAFSIWQPGVANLVTRIYPNLPSQTPQTLKTPVEIWQAPFAAWSANGSYLLADSGVYGWRIAGGGQPAPDTESLAAMGLTDAPVLSVRDAGMAAAMQSFHDLAVNPENYTPLNLAWSPDGRRLAVEAPTFSRNNQPQLSDFAVHFYDCASGKLLGSLTPQLTLNGNEQGDVLLRWSSDGSRLLLYDPSLSGAQIWGPSQLPR